METATEKIQLNLFEIPEYAFPKLSDLTSVVPKVKTPMFCPLVNMALELALLPGKGESVNVITGNDNDFAIIANHVQDGYVFIVQTVGHEIIGSKRGIRKDGFALNVLLDEKFKRPDATVIRKKEKPWDYCHYFYKSKKHELDEYRKELEGKEVAI